MAIGRMAFCARMRGWRWCACAHWHRIPLYTQTAQYDVLIRGGRILDGTGNPWFAGEIAIKDGRIAAVGHLGRGRGQAHARCERPVAAPGFIDLHTHSDISLLADGNAEGKVRDGVTLDVIGESTSVAPRDGLPVEENESVKLDWSNFTEYFERVHRKGISMNLISHVSAEQVRRVVMGYDDRSGDRWRNREDEETGGAIHGGGRVGAGDALRKRRAGPSRRDPGDGQGSGSIRGQLHLAHRKRRV